MVQPIVYDIFLRFKKAGLDHSLDSLAMFHLFYTLVRER